VRVIHVSSEAAPWSQTGGLGDVAGALPDALVRAEADVQVAVVSPMYRGVAEKLAAAGAVLEPARERMVQVGPLDIPVTLRALRREGRADHWFVDAPELFDREGIYGAGGGHEYADNHVRFAALSQAAVVHGEEMLDGEVDVLHGHDWQTGIAPVYLRLDPARQRTAAVFTIHNLAYRGLFPAWAVDDLGLPPSEFTSDTMEFFGMVSLLKGGIGRSDVLTTVSPSYAREILEPIAGEALDGYLATHAQLVGIVNGIDSEAWNPATDPYLPAHYDADDLSGKEECRRALADQFHWKLGDQTVVAAMVSRFADQKGADIVADLVPELHAMDVRLVVLGSGDTALEDRFRYLGRVFRDHVHVTIGFDVARARQIYAGADVFLMPSRFEPCGIGQLYAMRYGTIPVVHAVGGLRDTVADPGEVGLAAGAGTGFTFAFADLMGLSWARGRALALYRDRPAGWRNLVRAAMRRDSSWEPSAREYLRLYRSAMRARR